MRTLRSDCALTFRSLQPLEPQLLGKLLFLGAGLAGQAAKAQCTGAWVQMPVQGPQARSGHVLVYDAARSIVLLEGGVVSNTQAVNDTWIWNGMTWQPLNVPGPVPARQAAGAAFDPTNGEVVLFGGGLPVSCTDPTRFLQDTWRWNGNGWILTSSTGPVGREGPTLGYDAVHDKIMLFGGGYSCGIFPGDTWESDDSWVLRSATCAGRGGHAMWTDASGKVCFFGGYDGTYRDDMWSWDGIAWTQITQSGPAGRVSHAVAFEPTVGTLLLFGGNNASGKLADSWLFDGTAWSEFAGPGPSARNGHAMAYDVARQQIVLFGGSDSNGRLGDTWIWSVRPVITSQPLSGSACADRSHTFSVVAKGHGPFTYQWQRESSSGIFTNITDGPTASGSLVAGATTATLMIAALMPADAGNYQCIVSNACGAVSSNAASLSISALTGDLNCDCKVDLSDLSILLSNYGSQCQ